jgi:hypothetical protein
MVLSEVIILIYIIAWSFRFFHKTYSKSDAKKWCISQSWSLYYEKSHDEFLWRFPKIYLQL